MRLKTVLLTSVCSLALMTGLSPAQEVGVTSAVNQTARGTPPTQQIRTLTLGASIIHDEVIETDGAGMLQILLADGSTFTVGSNSSLTIDSFVYDPDAGTAELAASVGRGVFRFIGGRASKQAGGVEIETPMGTAGIRGGIADMAFGSGGPNHIDMVYGFEITLQKPNGQSLRLFKPGYSIVEDGSGGQTIRKTPPSYTQGVQQALNPPPQSNGGSPTAQSDIKQSPGTRPGSQQPPIPATPPTRVAQRGQQQETPAPGPRSPDGPMPGGPTSWGEIQASSLAGASASYSGNFEGTYFYDDSSGTWLSNTPATGDFAMSFDFGTAQGSASISNVDVPGVAGDDFESVPLLEFDDVLEPTSPPLGGGNAEFISELHGAGGVIDDTEFTYYGGFSGAFENAGGDIAQKVIGDFYIEPSSGSDFRLEGDVEAER